MVYFNEYILAYFEEEYYNACLLISEHLYFTTHSNKYLYYILKSLQRLNHNERIINFLSLNKELLSISEIKKIFLSVQSKTKNVKYTFELPESKMSLNIEDFKKTNLHKSSINALLEAKVMKEEIKRKYLIKAFMFDTRNMEALYILKSEKLIPNSILNQLIQNTAEPEFKEIYLQIFMHKLKYVRPNVEIFDEYFLFSPFRGFQLAKQAYRSCDKTELFKLGIFMNENYKTSHLSPLILGFYFLVISQYKDAKKCFYESLALDKTQGVGHLYLGIAISNLKEAMNAITCFKEAKSLMIGSYKPYFYLARESSIINDIATASFYFKALLKMKCNKLVCLNYICHLYRNEEIGEMGKIMNIFSNFDLDPEERNMLQYVMYFYYLSRGKFEQCETIIEKCRRDWKYYICSGYLKHLMGKNEEAADLYSEGLIVSTESLNVVNELLKLAYNGCVQTYDHDLVDYSLDIFEVLKIPNEYDNILNK